MIFCQTTWRLNLPKAQKPPAERWADQEGNHIPESQAKDIKQLSSLCLLSLLSLIFPCCDEKVHNLHEPQPRQILQEGRELRALPEEISILGKTYGDFS